jgi:Leucine-rich repeat (LRR) protein
LNILDVSNNLLTDNDTSRVSSYINALESITSINFSHNNIDDIASTWPNLMDTLIDLDFSYNIISDITPIK